MEGSNYRSIEDVALNAEVYENKEIPHHLRDKSQNWALVSLVGPSGCGQKHKSFALRIYGCKDTKQEANKLARALPSQTGNFDVLSIKTHEWASVPLRQSGSGITDERSNEERVDSIFARFKENEIRNKEILANRLDKDKRTEHPLKTKPEGLEINYVEDEEKETVEIEEIVETNDDEDDAPELVSSMKVPEKLKIRNQNFTVMSIVAPYSENEDMEAAIQIHGCRETLELAMKWEAELRESNPYFHVFTLENNSWGTFPPSIADINEVSSNDKTVQHLHDSYKAEEMARRKDAAKELEAMHKKKEE